SSAHVSGAVPLLPSSDAKAVLSVELTNPRGLRCAGRALHSAYLTVAIVFFTIACTCSGSGAYPMPEASLSPCSSIHSRKPFTAAPFAGSENCFGINSQVKLEIGYEVGP